VPIGLLAPTEPAVAPITVRRNRRSAEQLGELLQVSRLLRGESTHAGGLGGDRSGRSPT
jgi:hypothetical protein